MKPTFNPALLRLVIAAHHHSDLFLSTAFSSPPEQLGAIDTQVAALRRAVDAGDRAGITRHCGAATMLIARLASEANALAPSATAS